jgi:hypothetical protein
MSKETVYDEIMAKCPDLKEHDFYGIFSVVWQ